MTSCHKVQFCDSRCSCNNNCSLWLCVAAEANATETSSRYQYSSKDMNIQKIQDRANVRYLSVSFFSTLKDAMFVPHKFSGQSLLLFDNLRAQSNVHKCKNLINYVATVSLREYAL